MATSSSSEKPVIGIISMGEMGMGIAKLLVAHEYKVVTVSAGRSQHTVERIRASNIIDLPTDDALLAQVDIILSIVPPRDALATAKRFADVRQKAAPLRKEQKGSMAGDVLFIDLNAISPKTVAKIAALFTTNAHKQESKPPAPSLAHRLSRSLSIASTPEDSAISEPTLDPVPIKLLDGGIIGSPPNKETASTSETDESNSKSQWKRPSIPLSGPWEALFSEEVLSVLNMKFISDKLGTASALKACFASLTKGFTALATISYTTAATCGVLPELQEHLDLIVPGLRQRAEGGMTAMPPKAYRWVDEMKEIGQTFRNSGGMKFAGDMFEDISKVYQFVADETVLGTEKVGKRKRGKTVTDFTEAMEAGIQHKMQKREGKEEKLELAWRGSWGL